MNKICGVTPSAELKNADYGLTYTRSIYYPTMKTNTGISTAKASRTESETYYWYSGVTYIDSSSNLWKMLFKSDSDYYVASRWTSVASAGGSYGVYSVGTYSVNDSWLFNGNYLDTQAYTSDDFGVRPLVYLKTNLETVGKNSNGEWILK